MRLKVTAIRFTLQKKSCNRKIWTHRNRYNSFAERFLLFRERTIKSTLACTYIHENNLLLDNIVDILLIFVGFIFYY